MASVGGNVETKFTADVGDFLQKIGKVKSAITSMDRAVKDANNSIKAASDGMKQLSTESARAIRVAAGEARKLKTAMADVAAISQQGRVGSLIDNGALRQSVALAKDLVAQINAARAAAAAGVALPVLGAPAASPKSAPAAPTAPAKSIPDPKAVDESTKSVTRLSSAFTGLQTTLVKPVQQVGGFREALRGIATVATAVGAALGALALAQKAIEWGGEASKIEDARRVMVAMGHSVQDFREATKGLLSDKQIVQGFGLASSMGITAKEFQQMALIADAAAKKMGLSQEYAMDSLIRGAARSSARILDNIGILVDWKQAHADFAKSVGKTTRQLTDMEKKQSELQQVLKQGQKIVAEVRNVNATASDSYDRLLASVSNLAQNIGTVMIPVMQKAAEVAQWLSESVADVFEIDMRNSTAITADITGLLKKVAKFGEQAAKEGFPTETLKKQIRDSAVIVELQRELSKEKDKGANADQNTVNALSKAIQSAQNLLDLSVQDGRQRFIAVTDEARVLDETAGLLALRRKHREDELLNQRKGRIESEDELKTSQAQNQALKDRVGIYNKINDALEKQKAATAEAMAPFEGKLERPFQEMLASLKDVVEMRNEAIKVGGKNLEGNLSKTFEMVGLIVGEFAGSLGEVVRDQKDLTEATKVYEAALLKMTDAIVEGVPIEEVAAASDALTKAFNETTDAIRKEIAEKAAKKEAERIEKLAEKNATFAVDIQQTTDQLRAMQSQVPQVESALQRFSGALDVANRMERDLGDLGGDTAVADKKRVLAAQLFGTELIQARDAVADFASYQKAHMAALDAITTQQNSLANTSSEAVAELERFRQKLIETQVAPTDLVRRLGVQIGDSFRSRSLTDQVAASVAAVFESANRALAPAGGNAVLSQDTLDTQLRAAQAVGGLIAGGTFDAAALGTAIGAVAGGPLGATIGSAIGGALQNMTDAITLAISKAFSPAVQAGYSAIISNMMGVFGQISAMSAVADLARQSATGKRAEAAFERVGALLVRAAEPAANMLLALASVAEKTVIPIVGIIASSEGLQRVIFDLARYFSMAVVMVADWFEGDWFDTNSELDQRFAELANMTFDDAIANSERLASEQAALAQTTAALNSELKNLPDFFNIGRARANASLSGVSGNPMGRIVEGSTVIIQNASFNGVQDLDGLAAQLNTRARQALLRSNKPAGISTLTGRG